MTPKKIGDSARLLIEVKVMKRLVISTMLFLPLVSLSALAQSPAKSSAVESLQKVFAKAYEAKELSSLDAAYPYQGRVKIVVEHSLSGRLEVRRVRTFREAERWLRHREREDGTPFRAVRPVLKCKRVRCAYDFGGGIDHNHLYLEEILFGYRNGRPHFKEIDLYDGD